MGRWVEVEHTADLSLHVWGQDLADLFATAAQGMFALIATALEPVKTATRTLSLSAPDVETLLVDWLSELLYLYEVEVVMFSRVTFAALTRTSLIAEVQGFAVGEQLAHIKAVTFHNLAVIAGSDGYEAELVFDV